jgi:hypothetical protein
VQQVEHDERGGCLAREAGGCRRVARAESPAKREEVGVSVRVEAHELAVQDDLAIAQFGGERLELRELIAAVASGARTHGPRPVTSDTHLCTDSVPLDLECPSRRVAAGGSPGLSSIGATNVGKASVVTVHGTAEA